VSAPRAAVLLPKAPQLASQAEGNLARPLPASGCCPDSRRPTGQAAPAGELASRSIYQNPRRDQKTLRLPGQTPPTSSRLAEHLPG